MTLPAGTLTAFEVLATLAGAAYAVLAARRNRLCWIAGAIGAALLAVLAGPAGSADAVRPAGLLRRHVGLWLAELDSREQPGRAAGRLRGRWQWHLGAAVVLVLLSYLSAHWLAERTQAEWPLLDSLTTWFSLLATWLAARAKIENWIYWIVIDGVLVFLFYMQDLTLIALQFLVLIVIAAAGFVSWRRRLPAQAASA